VLAVLAISPAGCSGTARSASRVTRSTSAPRVGDLSAGCVVFSRGAPDGGLYELEPGGTPRRITTEVGDDSPAWSPDGTHVAFNRFVGGAQQISVMRADGTGVTRLTSGPTDEAPTWSPDGSRILFVRETQGRTDFSTMKPDGTNLRTLVQGERDDAGPAWSPDGSTIAFVGAGSENGALDLMRSDGSGRRTIEATIEAGWPKWSPDGTLIVFVDEHDGSIHVIDAHGGHERKIVDVQSLPVATAQNFTMPAWSPDGTTIVFAAGNPELSRLYTVRVDGSQVTQLTSGTVTDESPAWSSTARCG
jgi:Tol biopolymer transport system component